MKKILVIIMIMVLSLFAVACGGGNEPVTTPDGPTDGPIDGPNGAPQLTYSKWQMDDDSMLPEYLPTVEFDTAGHFTFTENVYEGMKTLEGGWSSDEKGFYCTVDINDLQGFLGQDVKEITFLYDGDMLVIKTDICMTRVDTKFKKIG
ncbi:MAG: hypothetical protein MJ171_06890 [Clostridia bacterium]|nr:hypothetical protein [Clostridia bacterium]